MSSSLHPEASAASGLNLEEGLLLRSASSVYSVLEVIGEGCFGKVVSCRNVESHETVAIKVLKKDKEADAKYELSMLEAISVLNPDQTNLLKYYGSFVDMGHRCLTFELLDINLYDLIELEEYEPLCPSDIRPIAEQLLVALDALKGLGIIHADIKPDNVMLVSAMKRPLRIKLVDFGEAARASEVYTGLVLQPIGYRAPEVCLGLSFTEAIDVWGVGCVLAYLYLADNLFPINCEYQMMRSIVTVLSQPQDHHLSMGGYAKYFFTQEEVEDSSRWRLMTPEEYTVLNTTPAKERESYFELPNSLDELVEIYPVMDYGELEDRKALIDLLKGLLHLDAELRLTPRAALKQPFFTMSYRDQDPHILALEDEIGVCPMEEPAETCTSPHQEDPQDSDSSIPLMIQDPHILPLEDEISVCPLEELAETCASPHQEDPQDSDSSIQILIQDPHVLPLEDEISVCPLDEPAETCASPHQEDSQDSDSSIQILIKDPHVLPLEDKISVCPLEEPAETGNSSRQEDPQDTDSGISELSDMLNTFVSVSKLNGDDFHEEESFESPDESGAEGVSLPGPTPTGRFMRVRERIRRIFKRIQTTFCCCCKSQTD